MSRTLNSGSCTARLGGGIRVGRSSSLEPVGRSNDCIDGLGTRGANWTASGQGSAFEPSSGQQVEAWTCHEQLPELAGAPIPGTVPLEHFACFDKT